MSSFLIEIYNTYSITYPILKEVKLHVVENHTIDEKEVSGATIFSGNNPVSIYVTTHICGRSRPIKDMIMILLHEMAHAIDDEVISLHSVPVYLIKNQTNKSIRNRHRHRNHVDSHHSPSFWDKYVEIVKIAIEKSYIKLPFEVTVENLKKIDMGH